MGSRGRLKNAEYRLLTRAAQKRAVVFVLSYGAATARERS
jgi:hypothetical protein